MTPLFRGGQGRTDEEIEDEGNALAGLVVGGFVVLVLAGLVWAICG